MRHLIGLGLAVLLSGCSGSAGNSVGDGPGDVAGDGAAAGGNDLAMAGGDRDMAVAQPGSDLGGAGDLGFQSLIAARPYMSKVPASYDANKAWPLVVLLHGYTATGPLQDSYFGLSKIVDSKGFLYAYPNGTIDGGNNHFWNATDACCNFYGSTVDDVAYLNAVISDMSLKYTVDPKRIFLIGHSNGGFMAHRMACDSASRIAGIVALAGDNWLDVTRCKPSAPIAVLQVHGDNDMTINYNGGQNAGHYYPSAAVSIGDWQKFNGCGPNPTAGTPIDLDSNLPGPETTPSRWTGCMANGATELWTIHGGGHIPAFQPTWPGLIYDWLAAHPKP